MRHPSLEVAALTIALVWAGWWVFFGVASGIGEGLSPLGVLVHAAVPGLVFLAAVLASAVWPRVGAWVLLAEGAVVLIGYPIMVHGTRLFNVATIAFVLATMAGPPTLAGALLLASRRGGPAAAAPS
ncbi:MAG: hypothetical protein IT208_18170 [Chthonomonadales bacterium]|nr:hypothetical protein [Chthonomonadales bacterium]